jgi:hypothetical protein
MNQLINMLMVFLIVITFTMNSDSSDYIWEMKSEEEISEFGNDGSGAAFELYDQNAIVSNRSVKVIPSGSADETKLSLPLSGERLQNWIGQKQMALNVYLPSENYLNPDHYFLGMADVTDGDWSWIDGTTWDAKDLEPGWNQIIYTLPEPMKHVQPENKYILFLAFSTYMKPREDGVKVPLYEPFLIDGIRML